MSEPLTLRYNLAELPSSQHRAGLAGLVLMVQWHNEDDSDKKGVCEISHLSETGATLEIDQEGLQSLFDKVYAASIEEKEENKLRTKKTGEIISPVREITRTIIDGKTAKSKEKTFYIYPQVIPHGAFLADYDGSEKGIWIKLWRDMVWGIVCSRDLQRIPYQKRANKEEDKNISKLWNSLTKTPNKGTDLSSSLFIGAEGSNAEDVLFKDRTKFQLLLNFWIFVAQIYVPKTWEFDRKTNRESPKDVGFALVIPDVADLKMFCEELPRILQQREVGLFGYRPKESIVDVAAEGALELMDKINERLATRINYQISDLLLGVDVFHLEKKGNNIRLWGNSRIDPIREMIDEYSRVKSRFTNALFRRQRILNVLNEKREWFEGFDSLLSKTDSEQTIGSSFFRSDVRKAFEEIEVINKLKGANKMDEENEEIIPSLIYQLVRNFITSKLDSKYNLVWKKVENNPAEKDKYNKMKGKIARESFLAIRSRTDTDFTEYFVSTLCAFPQFLKQENYITLANELHKNSDKVRTLTMLALSANGYSPRENQEKS